MDQGRCWWTHLRASRLPWERTPRRVARVLVRYGRAVALMFLQGSAVAAHCGAPRLWHELPQLPKVLPYLDPHSLDPTSMTSLFGSELTPVSPHLTTSPDPNLTSACADILSA